jgi:hypothetical protein
VQELSLASGDRVMAIGKIVPVENAEGGPTYQLYNPTFNDRFWLKPTYCNVTTGTKEEMYVCLFVCLFVCYLNIS